MSEPKNQHLVPKSLLKWFTKEQSDTGTLWVTDIGRKARWPSTPRKAAREKDFYTSDFGSDVDPYHVERSLAVLEGKWSAALKRVIETSIMPSPDSADFADIMGLIAFQATRGRSARRHIARLIDAHSKQQLIDGLSSPTRWSAFIEHARACGIPVELSREELLEHASRDDYVINADSTWTIQQQITTAIKLMLQLAMRAWSVLTPEDDGPDFICSDSPVCVLSESGAIDREIGFCQSRSFVTVPIGRRHAILGCYEGQLPQKQTVHEIAAVNRMTVEYADQVYAASTDFVYLRDDGQVATFAV